LLLAVLWTCLLISVSGLKANAWYLVGVRGVTIGKRWPVPEDNKDSVVSRETLEEVSELSKWLARNGDDKIPPWLDSMDGR
jgi:hypothetical protein